MFISVSSSESRVALAIGRVCAESDEASRHNVMNAAASDRGRLFPARACWQRIGDMLPTGIEWDWTTHVMGVWHSRRNDIACRRKTAEFIREYMGHASVATTYQYVHLDKSLVKDESVEVFDSLF